MKCCILFWQKLSWPNSIKRVYGIILRRTYIIGIIRTFNQSSSNIWGSKIKLVVIIFPCLSYSISIPFSWPHFRCVEEVEMLHHGIDLLSLGPLQNLFWVMARGRIQQLGAFWTLYVCGPSRFFALRTKVSDRFSFLTTSRAKLLGFLLKAWTTYPFVIFNAIQKSIFPIYLCYLYTIFAICYLSMQDSFKFSTVVSRAVSTKDFRARFFAKVSTVLTKASTEVSTKLSTELKNISRKKAMHKRVNRDSG